MDDLFYKNPAVVSGTPSLITGMLTDVSQALRLSSTDTWVVADSPSSSLGVLDGVPGGLTLAGWFSVPTLPGSTQTIIGKAGSYELKLTSAGKLLWILTNGGDTVTVTSIATVQTGTRYHFAGIYNGDYQGPAVVGEQNVGASSYSLPADKIYNGSDTGLSNLNVHQLQMLEHGHLYEAWVSFVRAIDSSAPEWVALDVYADSAGSPGALVYQSEAQLLYPGALASPHWYRFALDALVYQGAFWLGPCGGATYGSDTAVLAVKCATSGGTRKYRACSVSDDSLNLTDQAPDPFGTAAGSDALLASMYANYTPTARTGREGQAVIYLNGALDSYASYAHGISDTATSLQHPAGVACDLQAWGIWDRKLDPLEVALLAACR